MVSIKLSKWYEREFVHEPTGSKVKAMGGDRKVYVTGMHTPPEHRGKGGAHAVMKKLTDHLDSNGLEATLVAKPQDGSTDKRRLEALYRKHGFRKDGPDMVRKPKTLREFLEESAEKNGWIDHEGRFRPNFKTKAHDYKDNVDRMDPY